MLSDAIFSEDKKYRYILTRTWDNLTNSLMFIGLNPSTADEKTDDPTIIRCIQFAKTFGYGELIMGNLFAYRSTDPKNLKYTWDPVGPANNHYIEYYARKVDRIILAWGSEGKLMHRCYAIIKYLPQDRLYCFGLTKNHQPKHPLYLKGDTPLVKFHTS